MKYLLLLLTAISVLGQPGYVPYIGANGVVITNNGPLIVIATGETQAASVQDRFANLTRITNAIISLVNSKQDAATAIVAGDIFSGDVFGILEADGDTPLTIQPNSVALGVDTTGNYAMGDAEGGNALRALTADFASIASLATNAHLALLAEKAITATNSYTSLLATNAINATNAQFASLATNAQRSAMATNALTAQMATNALTAQMATNAMTAQLATNAQFATLATNAQFATLATNAQTATVALSGDDATGFFPTGLIEPPRLGTGTANATVFLRGDGQWAAVGTGTPGPHVHDAADTVSGVFVTNRLPALSAMAGAVTDSQVPDDITINWAKTATTATNAYTSLMATNAITAQMATNALTAQMATNAITAQMATNSLTSQMATNAQTATLATNAMFTSFATNAQNASFATNAQTATTATTATTALAGDSATAFFPVGTIEPARLPDLSAMNGAVTDGQVPNNITIDFATTSTTASTALSGDSATLFFSTGTIEAARLPPLSGITGAVTDGQVPNNITIDYAAISGLATNAQFAGTATNALSGDSATAFFPTGTIEAARLPDLSGLNGSVTDGQVPNNITIDRATSAATADVALTGDSATLFFTVGTVEPPRLGTGTANNTVFLRGDGVWAAVPFGAHTHDAADTVSGVFLPARIPALGTLSGTVTDAQVPDDITILWAQTATTATNALTAVTATNALSGDSATAFFPTGTIEAARLPDLSGMNGSVTDGQVPDNITVTLAQNAITATNAQVALTGDSATAFFPTGTIEPARLPTLDLMNGAVTDGQVPNNITVDLAATSTVALSGDSATLFFTSGTIESNRLPALSGIAGTVTDGQVPNNITIDQATLALTANVALTGDSATGFFPIGIIEPPRLGSGTADTTTYLRGDGQWAPVIVNSVGDGDKGDIVVTGGIWNIDANAIALGDDTTGNFVAEITGTANEIEVTGSTGENAIVQVGLPAITYITFGLGIGPVSFPAANNPIYIGTTNAGTQNVVNRNHGTGVSSTASFVVQNDTADQLHLRLQGSGNSSNPRWGSLVYAGSATAGIKYIVPATGSHVFEIPTGTAIFTITSAGVSVGGTLAATGAITQGGTNVSLVGHTHDFSGITGTLTDAQIPNNITIDFAATAGVAQTGDSATAFFSSGVIETNFLPALSGMAGSITDAQVPNNITIDRAAIGTVAETGDSATGFFPVGTIEPIRLGANPANNAFLRGDSQWIVVTGLTDGSKGDITLSGGGTNWTINPDSVALGTDTTGNYAGSNSEGGPALSGDDATLFFTSGTIEAARLPPLSGLTGSVTDGQVPNNITIDQATLALTANTALTGDSATAFFPTGTIEPARLGSGTTDTTTFLRGDSTWANVPGLSDGDKGDIIVIGNTWTVDLDAVTLGQDTTGNYAAGDAEAGAALTGDSATLFFSTGTIEAARLPALSGLTGAVSDAQVPDNISILWAQNATNAMTATMATNAQTAMLATNAQFATTATNAYTSLMATNAQTAQLATNALSANVALAGDSATAFFPTGQIEPPRLGSGTTDTTTFLRGDGQWVTVGGVIPPGTIDNPKLANMAATSVKANPTSASATPIDFQAPGDHLVLKRDVGVLTWAKVDLATETLGSYLVSLAPTANETTVTGTGGVLTVGLPDTVVLTTSLGIGTTPSSQERILILNSADALQQVEQQMSSTGATAAQQFILYNTVTGNYMSLDQFGSGHSTAPNQMRLQVVGNDMRYNVNATTNSHYLQVGAITKLTVNDLGVSVVGRAVVTGQILSQIVSPTPPMTMVSTGKVVNLNADWLDGLDSTSFALAGHTHPASGVTSLIATPNETTVTSATGDVTIGLPDNVKVTSTLTAGGGLSATGSAIAGIGSSLDMTMGAGIGSVQAFDWGAGGYLPLVLAGTTVDISTEGTPRWQVNSQGMLLPIASAAYDIGAAATRVRTNYAVAFNATGLITASQFQSTVVAPTPPLIIASTGLVSNLNADLLDTQHGSYYLDRANHTGTIPAATFAAPALNSVGVSTPTIGVANTLLRSDATFQINQAIIPTWTQRHVWNGAIGATQVYINNPTLATSNIDHQQSPYLGHFGNFWTGSNSVQKGIALSVGGITGQDLQYGYRIQSTDAYIAMFSSVGGLHVGNNASTTYPLAGVISAQTGFRINNAVATSGQYLRGNGVNYVASSLLASDLTGTVTADVNANVVAFQELRTGAGGADRLLLFPNLNPERGYWNPFWTAVAAGRPLNLDEQFANSNNGTTVYNNSGGSALTLTRLTNQMGMPNASGSILRFSYDGIGPTSPGLGGFYSALSGMTATNRTYVQRFIAKVPVGYNITATGNPSGANSATYWLSPVAGTGKWETYIRVTHAGNSGTFSTFPYIYLLASTGPTNVPFTWDLASHNIYDVTDVGWEHLNASKLEIGTVPEARLTLTPANVTNGLGYMPMNITAKIPAGTGDWNAMTNAQGVFIIGTVNAPVPGQAAMGLYMPHNDPSAGGAYGTQIAGRNDAFYLRSQENGAWTPWRTIAHSGNVAALGGGITNLVGTANEVDVTTVGPRNLQVGLPDNVSNPGLRSTGGNYAGFTGQGVEISLGSVNGGTGFIQAYDRAGAGSYLPLQLAGSTVTLGGPGRWLVDASALAPMVHNTYDLGTSALRPRVVYGVDMNLSGTANIAGNVAITGNLTVSSIGSSVRRRLELRKSFLTGIFPGTSNQVAYLNLGNQVTIMGLEVTIFSHWSSGAGHGKVTKRFVYYHPSGGTSVLNHFNEVVAAFGYTASTYAIGDLEIYNTDNVRIPIYQLGSTFSNDVGVEVVAWNLYSAELDTLNTAMTITPPATVVNTYTRNHVNLANSDFYGSDIVQGASLRATGVRVPAAGQGLELGLFSSQGTVQAYDRTAGAYLPLLFYGSQINLNTAGTVRWIANAAGHLIPGANNTYDVGSTTNRVRKIYATDIDFNGVVTGAIVTSAAGTANQINVNGGTAAATGAVTLSLPANVAVTGQLNANVVAAIGAGVTDAFITDTPATSVQQIRLGKGGAFYTDYVGTRYSGADLFMAVNAYQPTAFADAWTVNATANASAGFFVGGSPATAFSFKYRNAGAGTNTFTTFWTTPTTIGSSGNITTAGYVQGTQLQSTIASGTPPLVVTSPTVVPNLNVDMLDGLHAGDFALVGHTHPATGVTQLTGTANEVDVSAATGNVTVGLPDNVTVTATLSAGASTKLRTGTQGDVNNPSLKLDNRQLIGWNGFSGGVSDGGFIQIAGDNAFYLGTANAGRWIVTSAGSLVPFANNSFDVGSTTNRVRKVYTVDADISGVLTIPADSITLGTHTVGSYVALVDSSDINVTVTLSSGTAEGGTYSISTPTTINYSTKTLIIPNSNAPVTDQYGKLAIDGNAWAALRGTLQTWDGTAVTYAVMTQASDVPAAGEVPTYQANGTILWAPVSGSGAVSSVAGTANEVDVSPTTGNVIVGLPDNVTITATLSAGATTKLRTGTQGDVNNPSLKLDNRQLIGWNGISGTISDGGFIQIAGDDALYFGTDNAARWLITRAGHMIPISNNNFDLGSSTNKVRDLNASGIVTGSQFQSSIAGGSPPMTVVSNFKVTNLNADLLDGLDSTAFAAAGSGVTTLAGTANQVSVSAATGNVTVSLPNDVTIGNKLTVTGPIVQGADALGTTGPVTVNWAAGNVFSTILTGPTTFSFSGATAGQWITIKVTAGAATSVGWTTSVTWRGGVAPIQTVSKTDFYTFYYDGTYYGEASQNY